MYTYIYVYGWHFGTLPVPWQTLNGSKIYTLVVATTIEEDGEDFPDTLQKWDRLSDILVADANCKLTEKQFDRISL